MSAYNAHIPIDARINEFLKSEVARGLSECTPEQIARFHTMAWLDTRFSVRDTLLNQINLIDRTIRSNEKRRATDTTP